MKRAMWCAWSLAVVIVAGMGSIVQAQDNVRAGAEPIVDSIDPAKLMYDILVDGDLAVDDPASKRFKTLMAAYEAAPAGTADKPTVIGIKPNVYQIQNATHTSPSMKIVKDYITLLGLTNNRRSVVLADNRGLAQGGRDNGYLIDVDATGFTCRNLTILDYCNVDYEYPGDASKNLTKRSDTITQAVALTAAGDKHVYENVAILSRLDTMALRTQRSYFKNVYIEGTDDWMGGGWISVWEDCTLAFPTGGGVMMSMNVAFFHCKFEAARGMQFYKASLRGMERPVALINCIVPVSTPRNRVAWINEKAPPRPSLQSMTYKTKDVNGDPATIYDSATGEPSFEYGKELTDEEAKAFNPWNLLRAVPGEAADNWDPAGVRAKYEAGGQGDLAYRVQLFDAAPSARADREWARFPNPRKEFNIRTGDSGFALDAVVTPVSAGSEVKWSTDSNLVELSGTSGPNVAVKGRNTTNDAQWVAVNATAPNGIRSTAWVYVEPKYTDPPKIASKPELMAPSNGKVELKYALELAPGTMDRSSIVWAICDDASGANPREIAITRGDEALQSLELAPGYVGKFIKATLTPKHKFSDRGAAAAVVATAPIAASDVTAKSVNPNFRYFIEKPNEAFVNGLWTVTGRWSVDAGGNFENGFAIHPTSAGALLYQQDAPTGDMQVDFVLTPDKTAGQFFAVPGSAENGALNADFFVKYDARTGNGYSLRLWRTTESHLACMFQLFKFENGVGSPLTDKQVLSSVMKRDTRLTLKVAGATLTASATNTDDRESLSLEAAIHPNAFGGAGARLPGGTSAAVSHLEIRYPDAK